MPRLELPPFAKSFMEEVSGGETKEFDEEIRNETGGQEEGENSPSNR